MKSPENAALNKFDKAASQTSIVVTAGGSGSRLSATVKKQYLKISNKPVLYYSLKLFEAYLFKQKIIVVPQDDIGYVKKNIIDRFGFDDWHITAGGLTRHHSVYNGLNALEKCRYVLIHDGVRPFASPEMINELLIELYKNKVDGIIPCVKLKDTIKNIDAQNRLVIQTLDREKYRAVQTPQGFNYKVLIECYNANIDELAGFTDDSAILEKEERIVGFVDGDIFNIKITTPEDLLTAKMLIKRLGN